MNSSITVRDIDPRDKSWLKRQAREVGVSMGEPLDDHVPDAFLAGAAACRGLAIVTQNTGEFRNTGVETVDPWTVEPR